MDVTRETLKEMLEPARMQYARTKITELGYEILNPDAKNVILFYFKDKPVYFFPFTGWHSGRSITDGRGIKKLLNQIKP